MAWDDEVKENSFAIDNLYDVFQELEKYSQEYRNLEKERGEIDSRLTSLINNINGCQKQIDQLIDARKQNSISRSDWRQKKDRTSHAEKN